MRAPGAATIKVTVNGVTGTAPIVVRDPFALQAPAIVKPNTSITATETFTNTSDKAVRGLQFGLTHAGAAGLRPRPRRCRCPASLPARR